MTQSKPSWEPSWNLGRLVQTLDFFDSIPIMSDIKKLFFNSPNPATPKLQDGIIFDFSQPASEQLAVWGALDDIVMGGVSDSGLQAGDGCALFSGNVSTKNSGGFASVRTRNFDPPLNLGSYQGIKLRIKGDGKRYKFFLRDSDGWDSIAYAYSFDTTDSEWITVQAPFEQLTPVFRAKTQPQAKAINPTRIRSVQLMLSKFEYDRQLNPHFSPGQFCLKVQTISAYR